MKLEKSIINYLKLNFIQGLFPKMVFVVPMQTNIMVDSNYSVDMIKCNDLVS
jgi:hypothetical protein